MKSKCFKIVALSVGLSALSVQAFAGPDNVNIVLHTIRSVSSSVEAIDNELTKLQVNEVRKLIGEKSKLVAKVVDSGASVAFDEYAPLVDQSLQQMVKGGYESIPDVRKYVLDELDALSSSDVMKQADTLVKINERLNLSATEGLARAKSVLAATNEAPKEALAQLQAAAGAGTLQGKVVQEAAQDIQILKAEISFNQLQAQLIEATSSNAIAARQNATPDSQQEENGGVETTNKDKNDPSSNCPKTGAGKCDDNPDVESQATKANSAVKGGS